MPESSKRLPNFAFWRSVSHGRGLWHCARMVGVKAKIAGFGMVIAA
jgi:hypothetical protein